MDYKKEYDDMVRRCKELHDAGNALTKMQMEIVCPQLAKLGEDRIRNELMKLCEEGKWRLQMMKDSEMNDVGFAITEDFLLEVCLYFYKLGRKETRQWRHR